jgi:hypothetical protein
VHRNVRLRAIFRAGSQRAPHPWVSLCLNGTDSNTRYLSTLDPNSTTVHMYGDIAHGTAEAQLTAASRLGLVRCMRGHAPSTIGDKAPACKIPDYGTCREASTQASGHCVSVCVSVSSEVEVYLPVKQQVAGAQHSEFGPSLTHGSILPYTRLRGDEDQDVSGTPHRRLKEDPSVVFDRSCRVPS